MSHICRVCAEPMPKDRKGPDQVCPKCLKFPQQAQYKQFMFESNHIEGEDRVNPGDIEAVEYALATDDLCLGCILQIHQILGAYLNKPWVGKLRTCAVYVGAYTPPAAIAVPWAMENYCKLLHGMNSWDAHNMFQKIHPFQDLNGRVGRLIWLTKAVNEGYKFKIPFLQAYYYQTLSQYEFNRER